MMISKSVTELRGTERWRVRRRELAYSFVKKITRPVQQRNVILPELLVRRISAGELVGVL